MAFLQSNLHVNRPLTDMLIKFDWTQMGWLRGKFFPTKPVDKLSNQMRQVARENMLRLWEGKGGEAGKIRRVQFATGPTLQYQCELFAFEAVIDAVENANADEELSYQVQQMEAPLIAMNVRMEYLAIKDTLRDPTKLTQNASLNVNQKWSNFGSTQSDPIADLIAGLSRTMSQVQRKLNRLAFDQMVWGKMVQNPNVIERVKFQTGRTGAMLTPAILEDILSAWLEPGSVIIYAARYNAAAEGEPEQLRSFLGGDVVAAYVDEPGLMSWGLGYEFAWNGLSGTKDPVIVLQYPSYEGVLGSNNFRVASGVHYLPTKPTSGFLWQGVVDATLADFNGELD